MTELEFYALLDLINRDLRRGLLTGSQHDLQVSALVLRYEESR